MSDQIQYFHFTLGPVQSFVSQARRTRDFWAGSFLLSWLAAVAMKAVQVQTNDPKCIEFPIPDPDFLDYLSGKQTGKKPTQGSVPNRFKAKVPADFKPENVVQSVQVAWEKLATIVFENDLQAYADDNTQQIWQQQIDHFWDMSWVLCKDKNNSSAIDQRKNWRNYVFPTQAGVKCMMMTDWQELSGITTPHSKGLSNFWSTLQTSQKTMQTDLREGEHLCAIAFVKRRFVRHFDKLQKHPMPDNWQLSGWKLSAGVPSVAYLAAAHWLETAITHANTCVFDEFYREARRLINGLDEWHTRLHCLCGLGEDHRWTALDGNVFHPTVLENSNTYPDQVQARRVLNQLSQLNKHVKEKLQQTNNVENNEHVLTTASPFYAVLMMDGDSLGKQMSDGKKQEAITKSLNDFTRQVQEHVETNNGVLIYAGGDDVLAILPIEDALHCAKVLRECYLSCFKRHKYCDADTTEKKQVFSTLSGAIEYAHIKIPLTKVLYDAHHLLDDIAKEKTGRDSIAIRIQKPGGKAVEWSQPWQIALDDKNQFVIEALAAQFRYATLSDPTFSSKFFYKIRERFDILNPVTDHKGKMLHKAVLNDSTNAIDLMCMEYLNSGKTTVKTMTEAKAIIKPLLEQARRVTRDAEKDNSADWVRSEYVRVDAALFVRFLANKGVER